MKDTPPRLFETLREVGVALLAILHTRMGLASVELVTASLQSGAKIPGLPRADAEQLRDRLTAIGIGDEDGL